MSECRLVALSHLGIGDLCVIYDGFLAAQEGMLGIENRPRCSDKAGQILSRERDRHFGIMEDAARALAAKVPADESEREARARVLVDYHFVQCGELLSEILTLADLVSSRFGAATANHMGGAA